MLGPRDQSERPVMSRNTGQADRISACRAAECGEVADSPHLHARRGPIAPASAVFGHGLPDHRPPALPARQAPLAPA